MLRLDPNRTSDDIDIAYVLEAGEHALAVERLREACAVDLDDFITCHVGRVITDSVPDGNLTVSVRVPTQIGTTAWTSREYSASSAASTCTSFASSFGPSAGV